MLDQRVDTSASRRPTSGLPVAAVLRVGAYQRLLLSGLSINIARWMDMVALGWVALQLTDSPFMVGLAAFARSAPMMALGPFTGVVADRIPRARVLLITQSVGMATGLTLALLFATGHGSYGALVVLATFFGALWALDFPARRTALYAVVGPSRVATAMSVDTVSMQLARMAGPLLAGLALARLGPAACFAGVAVMYAIGLAMVLGLRSRIGTPAPARSTSVVATLGTAFAAVWRDQTVRAVLVITVLMNVLYFPYQHMLPVFARQVLAIGPEGLGALVAANGLGALLGALAIASRRGFVPHRRLFAMSVIISPILLVGLASLRWRWSCLIALLIIGAAESGFAAMQSTIMLLSTPEEIRGGAMGILSACIGTGPLGALWIGFLAAGTGAALAMALSSVVALALMLPVAIPLARRVGRTAPWTGR